MAQPGVLFMLTPLCVQVRLYWSIKLREGEAGAFELGSLGLSMPFDQVIIFDVFVSVSVTVFMTRVSVSMTQCPAR